MAAVSRREFVRHITADAIAAGVLVGDMLRLEANPLGLPIGSQTWPHRAALKQSFPGVLQALADLGVQEIEMCSPLGYQDFSALTNGREVRQIIADHGLECRSGHFAMRELRESHQASIAWAHDAGITQMITA